MDHKLQSELIRSLRRREKGYSDHPADKGGPTMDGVAEATARRYGYQGDMRDIPSSLIDSIYIDLYWAPLNLDTLSVLSTCLTRMEERQNVHATEMGKQEASVDDHAQRIRQLEVATAVAGTAGESRHRALILGGAATGGVTAGAVTMIASMLGIDEAPASLIAATKDPDKRAELVRINNENRRELESMRLQAEQAHTAEETKRLSEVNATMRAELGAEGWFKSGWRPAVGWVLALSFGAMAAALVVSVLRDPGQLPSAMDGIITLIVTMGTVLGVNINARTTEKHLDRTGAKPVTLMDAVKTRLSGRP